jgi:hypothetical protein
MATVSPREALPVAALARMAAETFLRGPRGEGQMRADELAGAIEQALWTAVRAERRACTAECARRGELWQRTADNPETNELARTEAEHRANEAVYLADLLATRADR